MLTQASNYLNFSNTNACELRPSQNRSLFSRYLDVTSHLYYVENMALGCALASIPIIATDIVKEHCQRTWTPINYIQCLLSFVPSVYAVYTILKEGFDRKYIKHTYLDREKNLNDSLVTLVVDADHSGRGSTTYFSSRKRSFFDMINTIYPVFFKKINGIDDLEEEQNKLLARNNVIKYLVFTTHSKQNLAVLGKGGDEFVGTQNFWRPNNELTLINRAFFLILSEDLTSSEKDTLLFDRDKFNTYRQSKMDQKEKNRIPNDDKLKKIFKKLDKDAKIIIAGCDAGKGNSNIAQHIAALAEGKEVIAPTTLSNGLSMVVKFDPECATSKLNVRFKSLNLAEITLISYIFFKVIVHSSMLQGYAIPVAIYAACKMIPYIGWDVTKVTTGQPEATKDPTYLDKFKIYYKSYFFPFTSPLS